MKNEYEKSLYTTQPKQHISTQIFFLVFDEEKYWTASNNKTWIWISVLKIVHFETRFQWLSSIFLIETNVTRHSSIEWNFRIVYYISRNQHMNESTYINLKGKPIIHTPYRLCPLQYGRFSCQSFSLFLLYNCDNDFLRVVQDYGQTG